MNPLRHPKNSWKHAGFAKLFQIPSDGGEALSLLDTKISAARGILHPGGERPRSKMCLCSSAPWGNSLRGPLGVVIFLFFYFFFCRQWLLLWFGHTLAGFREEGWLEGHKQTPKKKQAKLNATTEKSILEEKDWKLHFILSPHVPDLLFQLASAFCTIESLLLL